MKVNINLLPEKAKLKFAKIKKIQKARGILVLVTVIFFLFFVLILAFNLRLKKEDAALKSRLKLAQEQVAGQRQTELQIFLLKKRIGEIEKILKERKNVGSVLWEVFSILPPELAIKEAEASAQAIQVLLEAPSYLEASSLVDNFPRSKVEKLGGKSISLPSITREEEGSYQVDLKIEFVR